MKINDIVVVSDEFETTNGALFGQVGRVTDIKKGGSTPVHVTFFSTNEYEVFHESELTILRNGENNEQSNETKTKILRHKKPNLF